MNMVRPAFWLMLFVLFACLADPARAQADPLAGAAKVVLDQDRCDALAGGRFQKLEGAATWVTKAGYIAATPQRQAYCAVTAYVNPVNVFGMYLPVDNWNGRYLVRGCGGSCGNAAVELACGVHLRDGYACLITDMGHSSTTIDNNWIDNNLQGQVDFGYRATHVTTVAGKAIATAFYARPPAKSYFLGCSTGGRQGIIEAQRFPEDFDGIVAIAPASMGPYGLKRAATVTDVDAFNTHPNGSPILPARKAVLIHAAVVRACDGKDGIRDGIINDPRSCGWRPEAIACKPGAGLRDCLTPAQVAVVHKLYDRRGAMKGSELGWIGSFIRSAPLPGQGWQPLFDLGVGRGDPATIESLINPNNPDLRPFRDHGGKLILVQGLTDYSVMPPPTIDYHETMTRTMGGAAETGRFARLFLIPGMDHCAGGEGASAIDYMGAITAWVEGGRPTEALRGVHTVPGAPLDYFGVGLPHLDAKYIAFRRDHHAYPGPSRAVGKDAIAARDDRPLATRLAGAVRTAQAFATGAGYPRASILAMTQRAMWQLFYTSGADGASQAAALATLAATDLDPIARAAVAQLQAEQALN
jgi:feruloyl esterase